MKKNIVFIIISVLLVGGIATAAYIMKAKESSSKVFSNGQPYEIFETDQFQVKYPKWSDMDVSKLPNADAIKIAISNEDCSFFIKTTDLPATSTLQIYTDQVIQNFGPSLHVNKTEVAGNQAYLDAEIEMGTGAIMKNISNVYQIGNTLYSMAFIAEKVAFPNTCEQVMNEVVASVKVK